MKGKYDFMKVLTADPGLGVEFVERFQITRLAIAILFPVIMSILLAVLYSAFTGDAATAFTIAGKTTPINTRRPLLSLSRIAAQDT